MGVGQDPSVLVFTSQKSTGYSDMLGCSLPYVGDLLYTEETYPPKPTDMMRLRHTDSPRFLCLTAPALVQRRPTATLPGHQEASPASHPRRREWPWPDTLRTIPRLEFAGRMFQQCGAQESKGLKLHTHTNTFVIFEYHLYIHIIIGIK